MSADAPIVDIAELAFSYPTREIFKSVSLKIPRGQVVGIMGGSGSGKSTLLRLIGGQLTPSRGVCKVMGPELGAQACFSSRARNCRLMGGSESVKPDPGSDRPGQSWL